MTGSVQADYILETHGLGKQFGGLAAVDDVNLKVSHGQIHGLIGPNGAGKTTCFNLLTKKLSPTSGSIHFDGGDITRLRSAAVSRLGVARSFQISSVFGDLSVLENVRIALMARSGWALNFWSSERALRTHDERAMALLDSVGLAAKSSHRARTLPYGRRRALELATTLALDPSLLLLDEPMSGLGREDIGMVKNLIQSFAEGRTVLMVEHNLDVIADLCDHIAVMRRGQVIAEGDYEAVSTNAEVVDAYLGPDNA